MAPASSCESSYLPDRLMGFGCAWENQANFTGVAEHECVLRCMLGKSCAAVNYDVQERVCMRMEVPCLVLETHQSTHYQIFAPQPVDGCVQWIATSDWNYPRLVKYNNYLYGYNLHGVARLRSAGEVLPGRWHNNSQKAYTVQNNTKLIKSVFEVLVVKESCSLRWVYYDTSSDNPIPPKAIRGGHLVDGTSLFVAMTYLTDTRNVVGYYNHVIRMGTCAWGKVRNNRGGIKILTAP